MGYAPLDFNVQCECRRWSWREICAATAPGLVVHERPCPRCRRRMLIVYRIAVIPELAVRLEGVLPMLGRDVQALNDSVRGLKLPPSEESVLLQVAKLMAKAN